jgi:hypothetical protein
MSVDNEVNAISAPRMDMNSILDMACLLFSAVMVWVIKVSIMVVGISMFKQAFTLQVNLYENRRKL